MGTFGKQHTFSSSCSQITFTTSFTWRQNDCFCFVSCVRFGKHNFYRLPGWPPGPGQTLWPSLPPAPVGNGGKGTTQTPREAMRTNKYIKACQQFGYYADQIYGDHTALCHLPRVAISVLAHMKPFHPGEVSKSNSRDGMYDFWGPA